MSLLSLPRQKLCKQSGTDTADASQLPRKRSRKSKGGTASTAVAVAPASTTATDPTGATAAPPPLTRPPPANDYHHMSQRYPSAPSAATVVSASSVSSGSVPKGAQKGGGSMGAGKPPVAPAAHPERGQYSAVAATSGAGAKAIAGSESPLLNGKKGKGKARATKARCVSDAGATASGQTLSAPAFGGATEAESPTRGVSPSRFRRIAGSTDDLPTDTDRGSGKCGSRSSALKDDGISGAQGKTGASAETDWADCFLSKVLPSLGDW